MAALLPRNVRLASCFRLGNEKADVWKINIPSEKLVTFNENLIPIGTEPFHIEKPSLLYRKTFDNCFIVNSSGQHVLTELISENQDVTLRIDQETGRENSITWSFILRQQEIVWPLSH